MEWIAYCEAMDSLSNDAMNGCNVIGNGAIEWSIPMGAGAILADW